MNEVLVMAGAAKTAPTTGILDVFVLKHGIAVDRGVYDSASDGHLIDYQHSWRDGDLNEYVGVDRNLQFVHAHLVDIVARDTESGTTLPIARTMPEGVQLAKPVLVLTGAYVH